MSEIAIHFVRVIFKPVSEEEIGFLLGEDERLNGLFTDPSVVEYDGFERGKQDFIMYFYGTDADRMTSMIIPELRNLPCSDRAIVVRRYGDHGAREETMKLN
jgi:hypothetical protein